MDVSLKHTIMMMACLERDIGFDGKVVSSQGVALPDASVTVRSTAGAFSTTVKTDSSGAFLLKVPSLGQYVLDVSKAGYQSRSTNRTLYNAGLSEPVISLSPITEPQGGISGHVLSDATGLGIAGAKVCAGSLCATTSTSGYYTLALRPGQHQLEASHPNFFSGLGSADVASSYVNLSFSLFPMGDLDSPGFPNKGFDPIPIEPL
ncbi:MAG: carboxypeptidase-like regulatory domain-containing protein, partial [Myxococcota bacterium]|nr:carboxypeptidase-like regulatory domain-containing protein [Myxococcota bacterium]